MVICNYILLIGIKFKDLMFPNDDICNVDAARRAARRLFHKYQAPLTRSNEEEEPTSTVKTAVMGKEEVNRLMKATYEAIKMRIHFFMQPMIPTKKTFSPSSMFSTPTMTAKSNSKTSKTWPSSISVAKAHSYSLKSQLLPKKKLIPYH